MVNPAIEEIKRQRRAAFNDVVNRIITPVTGNPQGAYKDYDSTYQDHAKTLVNATISARWNPSSAMGKVDKEVASKKAKANSERKKAIEQQLKDIITVDAALKKVQPFQIPGTEPAKLTAADQIAHDQRVGNAKTAREVQEMAIADLTPDQFAELPVNVQQILATRKGTLDFSDKVVHPKEGRTWTQKPTTMEEAVDARPDLIQLDQNEIAALGPQASEAEYRKAVNAKRAQILAQANARQVRDNPPPDQGWLDRNVISHMPSPVKTGLMKGLDYLDRPRNAIVSGLDAALDSDRKDASLLPAMGGMTGLLQILSDEDQGDASLLDRIKGTPQAFIEGAKGVYRGGKGEVHTGYGDIIEDQFPKEAVGNDAGARWTKRLLGGAGDIALDPTTYVSFGVKTALEAGGKAAFKEGAEKAFQEAITNGASQVQAQAVKDAVLEAGKAAGKDAVSNAVKRTVNELLDKNKRLNNVDVTRKGVKVAARDAVLGDVQKAIDKVVYDIQGGAQKGKMLGSGKQAASTVGNVIAESYRSTALEKMAETSKPFIEGLKGNGKKFTVKSLADARKDPLFKEWHDAFKKYNATHRGVKWDKAVEYANKVASDAINKEARDMALQGAEQIRRATLRVPTLRVLGKEVKDFPQLGKIAASASDLSHTGRVGEALDHARKLFSYGSNFPGYTTLIGQKVKAEGLQEFNSFRKRVLEEARGVTRKDREAIQHAIESDTIPGLPAELRSKAEAIKKMYAEVRADEFLQGMNYKEVPNYAYQYYHGGTEAAKKAFKEGRSLSALSGKIAPEYNTLAAAAKGLRPEKDAYKNLLYRKLKSNRRITNRMFDADIAMHYGIQSTMSKAEATARELVKVPANRIPADLKKVMKDGHNLYLDKDIAKVMENFSQISKIGTEENKRFIRGIDYLTRKFKTLNTIYYPGFHIRNIISDFYMGMLDGVGTKDYGFLMDKMVKAAKDPNIDIDIGGRTVKWTKLKDAYERQAASGGFLNSELGRASFRGEAEGLKTLAHPTEYGAGIRRMSEHREDFGRLAHFKHAMDEELPAALKKTKNFDQAWDSAVNASIFRVNKYKFDYGALTKFEQNVMRRGIPFYTYMRKAIPTLTEAAIMSPRLLNYTNRWMHDLMPESDGDFNMLDLPDWVKETGFAEIAGGDEPWGVTGQALPQGVFNNFGSLKEVLAQTNPLVRGPFEIATGESLYSGKPIDGVPGFIQNNVRAFNTYDKLMDSGVDGKERLANIMGIPVIQISKADQAGQRRKLLHEFQGRLGQYDQLAQQKGYSIFLSERKDGVSIRVAKADDPSQSKDFQSLDEALAFLGLD